MHFATYSTKSERKSISKASTIRYGSQGSIRVKFTGTVPDSDDDSEKNGTSAVEGAKKINFVAPLPAVQLAPAGNKMQQKRETYKSSF
jgi:hypothetical protein